MLLAPIKNVTTTTKSQFVGFLLTLFLGPFGLFYSSVLAGAIFAVIAIAIGAFTEGVGAVVVWPICVIIGFFTVHNYNSILSVEEGRKTNIQYADDSINIEPKFKL